MVVNSGINLMVSRLLNLSNSLSQNTTFVGVGDSTTAVSPTDTTLLGTNKLIKNIDENFPVLTKNSTNYEVEYQTTFYGNEANFSWQEWGIFNNSTNGDMLIRTVTNNGTKVNGQTWVFIINITWGV